MVTLFEQYAKIKQLQRKVKQQQQKNK
jgi:hypothetical protein